MAGTDLPQNLPFLYLGLLQINPEEARIALIQDEISTAGSDEGV
ncbi:hypothetical protein E1A91_D09G027800v1 [Gossypium mustelinum]|uniref:Uncharacterized protein n=3 Tax=Gossypium TaxID=3633 RepID=A0A5D2TEJ5_GOSMU|nr:hypothetical protein ES288_D09G030000v1 [Gossypium darwinii]TYH52434.1 hypothetical protein ES332_D09G028400v1 [Gossypium tomentosum]TYH52435.1 hypothetical protein ES332_D09G028400v1 [Gossypium tomentosum]TYI63569.1 hypothetical protein E1A91_D09G027800v1 [Gossypium mustelinum]